MPVNIRHCEVCHNTTEEFASSLVDNVNRVGFSFTSEFELVVNSMLIAFGCPDCRVLRDDTFGLFVRHHTPSPPSSSFAPSQSTGSQGTGSLVGEHHTASAGTSAASNNLVVGEAAMAIPHLPSSGLPSHGSIATTKHTLSLVEKVDAFMDTGGEPGIYHSDRTITEIGRRRFLKPTGNVAWADEIESTPHDVSMGLGGGRTTEGNGIGDSKHASPDVQEEDEVALVGDGTQSTDYGSMPPLPSTLAETVSDSPAYHNGSLGVVSTLTTAEVDMLGGLEEMEYGQAVPAVGSDDGSVLDLPMSLGRGCTSERDGMGDSVWASASRQASSDSSVNPLDSQVPIMEQSLMIDQTDEYLRFSEVGMDMHFVKIVLNNLDHTVHALRNHVNRLESRVRELEDDKDTHGRTLLHRDKPPGKGRTPTPVPIPLTPAPAPGKVKTAAPVLVPLARAPALPRKPAPVSPSVVTLRPSNIPLPPAKPSYARAAAPTQSEKEFTLVQRRRLKSLPPAPTVTVRERHVTVRFDDRHSKTRLPSGVDTEMVKTSLNQVLASSSSPARFASCVQHRTSGDLLLTLAEHSALSVWKLVAGMERALMELKVHSFTFCQDTKKVKILASNIPFAPSGVGNAWKVEDWHGDEAFDDMVRDIELSNPGIHLIGRPHWVGSLEGHKSRKHVLGSVILSVELNQKVKWALDRSSIMVYSRRRPLLIWADVKPSSICQRCLQRGHVAVMCRAPVACKFCDGGHYSVDHSCPVKDCRAAKGSLCSHVRSVCRLCSLVGHLTGDPACPGIQRPSASTPRSSSGMGKVAQEETTRKIDETAVLAATSLKASDRSCSNSR
ncbi:unnamed protein product [Tuber aestivum]|uniref:Uncharacterized protein n=1 Tax=Tuber aestivum TaxID=59557 RepID=A0A292PJJ6_9PEZI|nr:unnamed protein product [Tuber aestivum]